MPDVTEERPRRGFLGIDPGESGGLVLLNSRAEIIYTPTPQSDHELWMWFDSWCKNVEFAVIEEVHAFPKQGAVSAFTFGKSYGKLLMALTARRISFKEVRPEVWQKALGITPRDKGTKRTVKKKIKGRMKTVVVRDGEEKKPAFKLRLMKKAQQLFPNLDLWHEQKPKGDKLAVCDALLIAYYCSEISNLQ